MERRQTVQKTMVLDAVRSLKRHATAEEVYDHIIKEHPNVGKGTVYRNLNLLAETGEIRRVEIADGPDRFDHTLSEHYHVECVRCGAVWDADMEPVEDMMGRIRDTHGAEFLSYDILFKGICPACQEKTRKEDQ